MKIPSFHDGYVTSIVLGENAATLGLRQCDGPYYELVLAGVEALQVDDFRQGNIIFEVGVITGRDPDNEAPIEELLERLFPGPHEQSAKHYHENHSTFLADRIAKIVSGEAAVVIITPSYGCDLVAYCASAVLRGEDSK